MRHTPTLLMRKRNSAMNGKKNMQKYTCVEIKKNSLNVSLPFDQKKKLQNEIKIFNGLFTYKKYPFLF